jgi:hypothetical protein
LLEQEGIEEMFPADVRKRAADILANMKGGTGAYSESKGVKFLREMVASGIEARDGRAVTSHSHSTPGVCVRLRLVTWTHTGCHQLNRVLTARFVASLPGVRFVYMAHTGCHKLNRVLTAK